MTIQPCPDCGTIMREWEFDCQGETCYGYQCPHCGQTWTEDDIQEAYRLMADDGDTQDINQE